MRKTDDSGGGGSGVGGRLSSSCSSIRGANYSIGRSYTPSFNTFKYSPASYTPNISRTLNSTSSASAADTSSRTRLSYTTPSSTSTNLSRTPSVSHKTLYSSPAAARVSVSSNDSLTSSLTPTNTYRGITKYSTIERSADTKPYYSTVTSSSLSSSYDSRRQSRSDRASALPEVKVESGPTTRTHMVHPTSSHIRSRSSYSRGNTVATFTQQARERAEREEKDRNYREWLQRENERESELGLETLHVTSSAPQSSSAQNDFRRSITSNSTSASASASSSSSSNPYRTNRYSSMTRVPISSGPLDDVMTTSYSSVAATPPPAYSQLSTSTSTLLRERKARLDREDESRNHSMTPQPSAQPSQSSNIPPPPPPPPPPRGGHLPRSVSAAVISTSSRPTAMVNPYEEEPDVCVVDQGFSGLRNIGNTCFINAVLQMIVNNIELREFFLGGHYKMEINESNPLGSEGRLAVAFADFMQQMWSGRHKSVVPSQIKNIVAEKASQFANLAQHDAHEFLSFLLDGLHEDVNRVKKKPLTGTVESQGRHDLDVSNEAWRNHLLRNDSIFVDLYHGQLKSHVQCPNCDRVSITFDPFVYLPMPFPKAKKSTDLIFWPLDNAAKPFKMTVSYSAEGTVADLLSAVGEQVKVPSRKLRACEALCHRFDKIYTPDMKASDIISPDYLFVFQMHDESEANEEIVVLHVVQRELYRKNLKYSCHECGKSQVKLKACEECYDAVYCSKECQVANWSTGGHRTSCAKRMSSDQVGHPLIISLPRSQLTYQHLYRVLEAKSRHTVTLFQQPQYEAEGGDSDSLQAPSKKRNGVGAPPSFLNTPGEHQSLSTSSVSSTPRRRSVLAEPRTRNQKMFEIRKLVTQNDSFGAHNIGDDESCQQLESGNYISINWINQRNGKQYITIGNRNEIDVNEEKSRLMTSRSTSAFHRTSTSDKLRLPQMISLFSETERLKPEESWYCSACKEHVEATKRLQLYRLPPVLIFQLKRFVYTDMQSSHRRSKDDRTVEYPLEGLDMAPFLAETAPKQASTMYDLTGVVCHTGNSFFGHYVSMARLADFDSSRTKIDWRSFDDTIVRRQSPSTVQTDDAYLLFYKLRDPSVTRSIFKRHYSCDPGSQADAEVKI